MSDCCKLPELAEATDDRCRRCGETGRTVLRETMESLLKPEALARLTDEPYYFDRIPECDVVYFSNEAGSYFQKDDLKGRVGFERDGVSHPALLLLRPHGGVRPRGDLDHGSLERGRENHRRGPGG